MSPRSLFDASAPRSRDPSRIECDCSATNGNGRVTRLLANLVFFAIQDDAEALSTYDWRVDKRTYIDLLREYDQTRDSKRLATFIPVMTVT